LAWPWAAPCELAVLLARRLSRTEKSNASGTFHTASCVVKEILRQVTSKLDGIGGPYALLVLKKQEWSVQS
jgi:hypothetical protein